MVQVSYHTHIPEYIPKYTWKGLVGPMWRVIRFNILMADLTLVPSKTMKVPPALSPMLMPSLLHTNHVHALCWMTLRVTLLDRCFEMSTLTPVWGTCY